MTKLKKEKPQENKDVYPYISFNFQYLQNASFNKCKNSSFFIKFLNRLKELSSLEWKTITTSNRHSYGFEKIGIDSIKKDLSSLTKDVTFLHAFRATGDNHVFLGYREGNVFNVIFIEANFGDIYNHG